MTAESVKLAFEECFYLKITFNEEDRYHYGISGVATDGTLRQYQSYHGSSIGFYFKQCEKITKYLEMSSLYKLNFHLNFISDISDIGNTEHVFYILNIKNIESLIELTPTYKMGIKRQGDYFVFNEEFSKSTNSKFWFNAEIKFGKGTLTFPICESSPEVFNKIPEKIQKYYFELLSMVKEELETLQDKYKELTDNLDSSMRLIYEMGGYWKVTDDDLPF